MLTDEELKIKHLENQVANLSRGAHLQLMCAAIPKAPFSDRVRIVEWANEVALLAIKKLAEYNNVK